MERETPLPLLNADVGEDDAAIEDGTQAALLDLVSLANVACGGHAGSRASVDATIRQCAARGVQVGAHPSYPDREGFGRRAMQIDGAALCAAVAAQVALVAEVARAHDVVVAHIKPHGALYHVLSDDPALARAVAHAAATVVPHAAWVLRAHSRGLAALRGDGRVALAEGFVDRRYASDGNLVPRDTPGALLDSPRDAAEQALALARRGDVDTLCIHGDRTDALAIARAVRDALDATRGAPDRGGNGRADA